MGSVYPECRQAPPGQSAWLVQSFPAFGPPLHWKRSITPIVFSH
jgi:hypothetical protein